MTPEENQIIEQIKHSPAALRVYRDLLPDLKKNGREYEARCVLHADKNPSLRVYQKDGIWMWTCHSGPDCGSGNVIQAQQRFTGVTFKEALETVKQKLGSGQWDDVKKKSSNFAPIAPPEKKRTFTLAQHAKYETALADSEAGLRFLRARGLEHTTAQRLHLGFIQDISKFCPKYAAMKKEIAAQGWISIPYIKNDTVVLVQYRSIVARERCRFPGMSTCIYNSDAVDPLLPVFVLEGAFDAQVMEQSGFKAVAMYNASQGLSPEDKDIIMNADSVILAVDTDEAGQACAAKLQAELGEKTLTIRWPEKDANDTLLKTCGGDKTKFKELVDGLVSAAKANPMAHVYSLQETMCSAPGPVLESPNRLPFPWPDIDAMVNVMPGNVLAFTASKTGAGKTDWVMNVLVELARSRPNWCVVNYSAELTPAEYAERVTAYLLKKDRRTITSEDGKLAAKMLGDFKFYIGRDPNAIRAKDTLDLIESAVRRFGANVVVLDTFHSACINEADQVRAQENAIKRFVDMCDKYKCIGIVVLQPRKPKKGDRGGDLSLEDARGAGAIMEAAHAALFMEREEKSKEDSGTSPDPWKPLAHFELKKGRSLGMGKNWADLLFLGEIARYVPANLVDKPPEDKLF